jgi:predicted nucleic acid-binding Zn ribbon protein
VCKKVCPVDKETCSNECEEELKKGIRKRKFYYYLLWAMMGVFVALMLVMLKFGGG